MKKTFLMVTMILSASLSGCAAQIEETERIVIFQETWSTYPADELLEKYYRMGDFEKAITYVESTLNDITWGYVKDEHRIRSLNAMIGDCYLELGDYEKGKSYIDISLEGYEEAGESIDGFHNLCYIEGKYYLKTDQYKTAIDCFEKSIEYAEASRDMDKAVEMDMARIYCDMGNTYMKLEDMSSALKVMKESYNIISKRKLESELAFTYYKEILEPAIKTLFENSTDGEIEYDEWFSEQF